MGILALALDRLGASALFGWVSFLYAGVRARERSWLVWAGVYAIPWLLLLVVPQGPSASDTGAAVVGFALMIVWVVSSVHAFRIRGEYLRRIAHRRIESGRGPSKSAGASTATNGVPINQVPANWYTDPAGGPGSRWWNGSEWTGHTRGGQPSSSTIYSTSATPGPSSTAENPFPDSSSGARRRQNPEKIDVNSAGEGELAALPGIGTILAKRIVAERRSRGGFQSVDELATVVELKPHVLQRVRGSLTAGVSAETPSDRSRGRVVDF